MMMVTIPNRHGEDQKRNRKSDSIPAIHSSKESCWCISGMTPLEADMIKPKFST